MSLLRPSLQGERVTLASPQTSFGVCLSRIHFSPTDVVRGGEMNAKRTPKDVCGEARVTLVLGLPHSKWVKVNFGLQANFTSRVTLSLGQLYQLY